MSSVNRVEGYQDYSSLPENWVEEKLAPELLEKILYSLSRPDLNQASFVNKRWRKVAIVTEKRKAEERDLERLTQFLDKHIDAGLKKELFTIIGDTKILKPEVDGMQENILNKLKNLDVPTLGSLQHLYASEQAFNNSKDIFFLAKIYKEIDRINACDNEKKKYGDLYLTLEYLFSNGAFKKAIEVADTIPNEFKRSEPLETLVDVLLKNDMIKEAAKIANTIPDDFFALDTIKRSQALEKIVKALLQKGDIEEATTTANMIPDDDFKSSAFFKIVKALLQEGNTEEAPRITQRISDDYYKSRALQKIAHASNVLV